MTESFTQFLHAREVASLDYVRGQPDAFLALAAAHGKASFFPPGGGHVRGAVAVKERQAKDAEAFDEGTQSSRFEIFHSAADHEVGYWTGLQHARVQIKGKDELLSMTLRVTEVFRREDGEWKIVHRHADMLAEPQEKAEH
ncbi:nuclear transport factor 2 family protein [Pelomonas sp. Root1237]|uniref:YybH family protein n=1 Tax=Pelomonas sp. Root1237 TaxID=1736434 RepID=UPI0006F5C557|nr:nuclear transport factor 2 family protein [Pelomonas sp. Root1237]KQV88963.1 hypothetical protein ASC91_09930 [Pelomonas sp. Root1237]